MTVRPETVEAAADVLRRYAPGGVSIETPYLANDEDHSVALDETAPVGLRAWLAITTGPTELASLRRELRSLGAARVHTRTAHDEGWAGAWERFFPVLRVGARIVVRPSWRKHRARQGDVVITLDPGMAFGTGQHETTRMCLEALEQRMTRGARVLDVGCGSGILSIAAALLGAAHVHALDIDAAAVQSTRANADVNGVAERIRVALGSVGEQWPLRTSARGRYELVLANISSRAIQELAEELVAALAPGGTLLASGFVTEQEPACRAALESAGGRVVDVRSDGEWRVLVVEREPLPE